MMNWFCYLPVVSHSLHVVVQATDRQTERAREGERAPGKGGGRGEGDFGNRIAFQGNPFEYMALDL